MLNTKNTISISEARKDIYKIADKVQRPGTFYTLTEKGKPRVVMVSAEEYDSLLETMDILSDPEAMTRIREAEKAHKKGDYVKWDDLRKELLEDEG